MSHLNRVDRVSASKGTDLDPEFQLGGVALEALAIRAGTTPFYAYDRAEITRRMSDLRAALPERLDIAYAMKANPMPALVCHMAGIADGFDVASHGEMLTALDSGMDPARISFAGPGKRMAEIDAAVAAGVTIIVESGSQVDAAAASSERTGRQARLLFRLNPPIAVAGSGMRMGGGASPFGMDPEHAIAAIDRSRERDLRAVGFHIYSGSQNLDGRKIAEAQRQAAEVALDVAERTGLALEELNVGGGFGVPYHVGQAPLDLMPVAAQLSDIRARLDRIEPESRLVIELGRYLVAEAGIYVVRVLERKLSRGRTYLVTDGGLHHNQAAAGLFGQMLPRSYPIRVGGEAARRDVETVDIVGCLCTPIDSFGRNLSLPRCDVGALIAILNSGAYGASASPERFLGHASARELLV